MCFANRASATFTDVAVSAGVIDAVAGHGVAWGDYDNDGDVDLFVANEGTQDFLYRNNGNGTFTDVAAGVGMADAAVGVGAAWGDYDNDGDIDLYVANGQTHQDFLYRNNGNGTFTDVAPAAGMIDASNADGVAWDDFDRDGDLDLFVINFPQAPFLYRNNGDGTFTNIAGTAGLVASNGVGAALGDYDADGDRDLYVPNTGSQSDFLYRNNGNGTFTEVAASVGMTDASIGLGAAWGDYNNDGHLDLYVASSGSQQDLLYRNNGNGTFTDVAAASGMTDGSNGVGSAWGDYDADGDLDLYVTNTAGQPDFLYRNNGNGTFTNASSAEGTTDVGWGYGSAWGDYDNDGDLDLAVGVDANAQDFLYRNNATSINFIKVYALTDANGNAIESDLQPDRLAIGAKVEIDLDGGTDFATGAGQYVSMSIGSGDGFAHSAIPIYLGTGLNTVVDVRVTFPDGDVVVVPGVAVNQTITVNDPGGARFARVDVAAGLTDASDGQGASWADYDNDSDLDLFVANYSNQQDFLYQNNGNGTFTNVATAAGIMTGISSVGAAWGDYDNDGNVDVFNNHFGSAPFLYHNNGNGTFTDMAASAGISVAMNGVGAGWADYDQDGDLDLFVANHSFMQDFLYRNNGDGTFTDVATSAGIVDALGSNGVAWADYDNDGDIDLFVSHDGPNSLYRNNGNGTFTDVASSVGMTDPPTSSQGASWGDYDNDGDLDLYVSNTSATQDYLYRNNGNGTFTNVATSVGMTDGSWGLAPSWADYDGDADLDIFVSNQASDQDFLYRNNGGTFTQEAVAEGMADASYGSGNGWADYDADGDVDLFVANYDGQQDFLYRNTGTPANWIKVFAMTDADNAAATADAQPDRIAVGAQVEIDLNGGANFTPGVGAYVLTQVGAGDGYSQSSGPAHLLVGTATTVDVRVTFPDGDVVVVPGVSVNQPITVLDPGAPAPVDVTPPVISNLTACPHILWPPNHKLVNVTVSATVADDQDPAPTFKIIGVTCNEPSVGDIIITGDHTVKLRAERDPHGTGRIYTIAVEAKDASGNISTDTVTVKVPKSMKNKHDRDDDCDDDDHNDGNEDNGRDHKHKHGKHAKEHKKGGSR